MGKGPGGGVSWYGDWRIWSSGRDGEFAADDGIWASVVIGLEGAGLGEFGLALLGEDVN